MTKDYIVGGVYGNAFDIDADGMHLWLAVRDENGFPLVLKLLSSLEIQASVSFEPGDGTEVNLQAGDFSSYWLWATGNLGGTDKVILSQDAGSYWLPQDEGDWVGTAHPVLVGPGDDSLISTSTGLSFWQNRYEGVTQYWVERTIPNEIWAIDRMDDNFEETYTGAYWYSGIAEFVHHSPNSGLNWENLTSTLPVDSTITSILAGR